MQLGETEGFLRCLEINLLRNRVCAQATSWGHCCSARGLLCVFGLIEQLLPVLLHLLLAVEEGVLQPPHGLRQRGVGAHHHHVVGHPRGLHCNNQIGPGQATGVAAALGPRRGRVPLLTPSTLGQDALRHPVTLRRESGSAMCERAHNNPY